MPHHDEKTSKNARESLRATLMLLAFGIGVLAFLVAIGRPEWFHIRPVSGTAAALSLAGTPHAKSGGEQP